MPFQIISMISHNGMLICLDSNGKLWKCDVSPSMAPYWTQLTF